MEKSVLSPACGQALIDKGQRRAAKRRHLVRAQVSAAGKTPAIDALAIVPEGGAQLVQQSFAILRIKSGLPQQGLFALQRAGDLVEPAHHLGGNGILPVIALLQQSSQKIQIAAQVTKRDHRDPAAGQSVIGVVPFGPLGVHPDPTIQHQIRQLGQDRDQQLFQQIDMVNPTLTIGQKLAVGSPPDDPLPDAPLERTVESDGISRVAQDVPVGPEAKRYLGVTEDALAEHADDPFGIVAAPQFEQPQQVDDLVIPPVADIAPGIIGRGSFPVHPIAVDPVGIEAVHGGGVDELGDHVGQKSGESRGQGLPVLEDVPPVALVTQDRVTRMVAHADGKVVPGPAGVAMATAEMQRQVFQGQPDQVRIPGGGRPVAQLLNRHLIRQ